jgi:transposase
MADARTARFCAGLLAHEPALWTFTHTPGVPATNNAAERALRHAVMWRKPARAPKQSTATAPSSAS